MAETLGSLCDKLTIIKLKQYHTTDQTRQKKLVLQEKELCKEIDEYVNGAVTGAIPVRKLSSATIKVFKKQGNEFTKAKGTLGTVFAELARVNCELWHEQEKVYQFHQVPAPQKDKVVKQLAVLNLKRNHCIDTLDKIFQKSIANKRKENV